MLPEIQGEFRVVNDPELRFTPSGTAVASFRMVADKKKKQGEEWVDDKVCWLNCSVWERKAENVAESIERGDLIFVKGVLETREYETREGEKRTSLDVTAYQIGPSLAFKTAKIDRTARTASSGGGQQQQAQSAAAAPAPVQDPWGTPPQSEEPPF